MKKIESKMLSAIKEGKSLFLSNTSVIVESDGYTTRFEVFLHGNKIYTELKIKSTGYRTATFSLCGWNTQTTKSRLRALGVNVVSKNKKVYYNGKEINIYGCHVI